MKFLAVLFLLIAPSAFAAEFVQSDLTKATLVVSNDTVKAGESFKAGLLLQHKPGWHTYWENPGDAGIPTTLDWQLPEGVKAGSIEWPAPEAMREDILVVYGYKHDILLPVNVTVPADYSSDTLPITLKASWLICENICIPENVELSLSVHVAKNAIASRDASLFTQAEAQRPKPFEGELNYSATAENIIVTVPEHIKSATLFARTENVIDYAANPTITHKEKTSEIAIKRATGGIEPDTLTGYLTADGKTFDIAAKKGSRTPAPAANTAQFPFIVTIIFAMLGGLVLNLMPCVLPVLSLKALAIAKKSTRERKVVVFQALAYTLGVLVSFALIAGLLLSLQHAGEAIGWGYQMQSPVFVSALIILLFLVGLNLAGMFDVPVLFGSALQDTREHHFRGSFFTGILATAVATPCTAPFMATAVGATLTMPPLLALLVFLSIGIGLALPFLLIAIFPALLKYLPKPGAWMESFKQFLSFPMFASTIWLLWVLAMQAGADGLLITLITLLIITFLVWLKKHCKDGSMTCRIAIILLLLAALINGLNAISNLPPVTSGMSNNHEAFSEKKLEQLRKQGKAVFVDATAAWCLTCQVNGRVAIRTEASMQAFEDTNTTLMIADWTNRNEEITKFLKRFGYNGVPLYVYFPASGEPVVLPQLLSESLVISTLKGETYAK